MNLRVFYLTRRGLSDGYCACSQIRLHLPPEAPQKIGPDTLNVRPYFLVCYQPL